MEITEFKNTDIPQMIDIWNEVVSEGNAFPQTEPLNNDTAKDFFASQSYTAVAKENGRVLGLYVLHPNNIGRAGHICNASYAVSKEARGRHIGKSLVLDCIENAKRLGFGILQFNAVVHSNAAALHLYSSLGFTDLGIVPKGFLNKKGAYEDIHIMYYEL